MIFKRIMLSTLALFCLLYPGLATAGGVVIDPDSVEIAGGRNGVLVPGAYVKITARASIYQYGSDKSGYIVFLLHPRAPGQRAGAELYREARFMLADIGRDDLNGPLPLVISFRVPDALGDYTLSYSMLPTFVNKPLKTVSLTQLAPVPGKAFEVIKQDTALLKGSLIPGLIREVTSFTVSEAAAATTQRTPPVYLRVNGQPPSAAPITGGIKDRPVRVSWLVGPEYSSAKAAFEYRYKLYPMDETWSAWSRVQFLDLTFLQRGFHDLRVQARHLTVDGPIVSKEARLSFTLNGPLVAPITKGTAIEIDSERRIVDVGKLYPRSRALLVGMWQFDDRAAFPQFDGAKISADVTAMERALRANGFTDVQKLLRPRLTKDDVDGALGDFISRATAGDRLVIYFSTHGFADPLRPSDGYLATSNCEIQNATARCLPLAALQDQAKRALEGRQVKQILFAIDSCFSGLGTVSKGSVARTPDLSRLAAAGGAYMLTAGMADQKALIDPSLGMSTFTYFLAKGLEGDADILQGGVITLSELLLYVQFEVARATESRQIPMLGRIVGDGEMLFMPQIRAGSSALEK